MTNERMSYCAIVLVMLFGVLTLLSLLYLYHMCVKDKEERAAQSLKWKQSAATLLRHDQVPALIDTSQTVRQLQSELQRAEAVHKQVVNDLEKRIDELVKLGQRQER